MIPSFNDSAIPKHERLIGKMAACQSMGYNYHGSKENIYSSLGMY